MTAEQAKGILRALIAAIGGGMVSRGWITAENWDWILGGIAVVVRRCGPGSRIDRNMVEGC